MSEEILRPAWSQSLLQTPSRIIRSGSIRQNNTQWAWGNSTGKGVRVAVVDSGVEFDHPALGDCVRGGVVVEYDAKAEGNYRIKQDDKPMDVSGHGTACAGIIHSIAPGRDIQCARARTEYGRAAIQFAAGLDWTIENDMQVVNLA